VGAYVRRGLIIRHESLAGGAAIFVVVIVDVDLDLDAKPLTLTAAKRHVDV